MIYQIVDNGGSIRMVGDQSGELLLMKRQIQRISVIREDMIEINTGDPLRNIFFRWADVYDPQLGSALLLRDFINSLITGTTY
jgi:hypothetical protein